MENSEKYLLHCTGIYNMLVWIAEQKACGLGCNITNQFVFSHPLVGKLFSLGIAKNNKLSKNPFLAIQPNETKWFGLIQWKKICIRERDLHLYFISEGIKGDNMDYPDIPPFVFAISFDLIEKINILRNIKTLEGREYRQDDSGILRINFHSKVFTLPLEFKQYEEPILRPSDKYTGYNDLMRQKESFLQANFSTDNPPEFKGDTQLAEQALQEEASSLKKMVDKLKNLKL